MIARAGFAVTRCTTSHPLIADISARAGASLEWNYCRPPIEQIEFEMDVRRVATERVLAA